jgi:5-methylcytosine-specific restriction endonuclease McrA
VRPVQRRCLDCNRLIPNGSRCAECKRPIKARRNADAKLSLLLRSTVRVCCLCGEGPRVGDPMSLEHHVPISKGGTSNRDNVGVAHSSCNTKKRDR